MAQPPAGIPPPEGWKTLQGRHEVEFSVFRRKVQIAQDRLLEKHAREEQEFWGQHSQASQQTSATQVATTANNSRAQQKPSIPPAKRAASQTSPSRAQQQTPKKAPAPPSTGSRTQAGGRQLQHKLEKASTPTAKTPIQTKARHVKARSRPAKGPEIIDLTSDDGNESSFVEETQALGEAVASPIKELDSLNKPSSTVQEVSIPQAKMTLFGNKTKKPEVFQEAFQLKHEDDGDVDERPDSSKSVGSVQFLQLSPSKIDSVPEAAVDSGKSAAPVRQTLLGTTSRKKPIPLDTRTESSVQEFRQERLDTESIIKEPAKLSPNRTEFALQQQKKNGCFVSNILHNGRSQNLAPELNTIFASPVHKQDTVMQDANLSDTRNTSDLLRTPSPVSTAHYTPHSTLAGGVKVNLSDVNINIRGRQLLSPPSSYAHSPIMQFERPLNDEAIPFKKPSLPSSSPLSVPIVSRSDNCGVQEPAMSSQASSCTLPNGSEAALDQIRSKRDASVASRASILSRSTTLTLKRKNQIDMSSGEDSVSDYEPDSPSSSPTIHKSFNHKGVPVAKKARATKAVISKTSPSTMHSFKRRNAYRIKDIIQPQPSTPQSKTTETPTAPGAPNNKARRFTTPESPSLRAASFNLPMKPQSDQAGSGRPPSRFGHRAAKLKAKDEIRSFIAKDEQYRTEASIQEAEDLEDKFNSKSAEDLPNRMRGMSMTPVPTGISDSGSKDALSTSGQAETKPDNGKQTYGGQAWLNDRLNGDRFLAKSRMETRSDDNKSSDSEASLSKYEMIGNVIIAKDTGELDLTMN